MDNVIRVDKVTKSFSHIDALENLTFCLSSGNILGVVGPNGAGKTTLINLLSGVYETDVGKIFYYDIQFKQDAIDIKKRLGVLPERLGLFEQLRGEEYLYFVARFYGLSESTTKKYMDELFFFMDMEGDRRKFIHQYSMGMRKKIAISAVLIHSPDIIIMDEPFENIDPISLKNINNVIKNLAQNGSVVIITSQILQSLEKICTDILIIDDGKNILFDKVSNIHSYMKESIKKGKNSSLEQLFFDILKESKQEKSLTWI
jgi:ABC-2 type transport system ATP-binding protein